MRDAVENPVVRDTEEPVSRCDRCARPGTCCSGFPLTHDAFRGGTEDQVDDLLLTVVHAEPVLGGSAVLGRGMAAYRRAKTDPGYVHVQIGLPFRRLFRAATGWRFWCPMLGRDGRCTHYEHRPAVCRAFEPGSGEICCHHVGPIGACFERVTRWTHRVPTFALLKGESRDGRGWQITVPDIFVVPDRADQGEKKDDREA